MKTIRSKYCCHHYFFKAFYCYVVFVILSHTLNTNQSNKIYYLIYCYDVSIILSNTLNTNKKNYPEQKNQDLPGGWH